MRKLGLAAVAATLFMLAPAAHAQDAGGDTGNGSSFRGFRIEGDIGGGQYHSLGQHDTKFDWGGEAGFDGQIGRWVIGPEVSYWHGGEENCAAGLAGGTVCSKGFGEIGAAVRAGYLVTPSLLVYGKGGYVNQFQRKDFTGTATEAGYYDRFHTDGYQVGGGAEYSLTKMFYVNAEYKYSKYDDHTLQHRALIGAGVRF